MPVTRGGRISSIYLDSAAEVWRKWLVGESFQCSSQERQRGLMGSIFSEYLQHNVGLCGFLSHCKTNLPIIKTDFCMSNLPINQLEKKKKKMLLLMQIGIAV